MTNLLAQRKDIKRAEKVAERRREEEGEQRAREEEEARLRGVRDFEMVQQGLEAKIGRGGKVVGRRDGKITIEKEEDDTELGARDGQSQKKRKFEIDEDELKRIAMEERNRAKATLTQEKRDAAKHLPSFWVPGEISLEPSSITHTTTTKQTPVCPSSDPIHPHPLSLKTLVPVNFTLNTSSTDPKNKDKPTCPACLKTLSNASKAILAVPCGHVLCKPCVDKFLRPEHRHAHDGHDVGPEPESVHCYVCDADLSQVKGKDKDRVDGEGKKDRREKGVKPGLVEIRSEGTGFAGGGKAVVKRDGVAFQV
jgi:nitric oxide synthase-interacting protein